ncbi:pro-neuregulin-2, membrane-bound isoform-like isoform X2 [Polypterus senegalus]|uniref:pro-neuregulin-2, membrane-bound isoform-like isoform X2 n=1 Tax=Polypterus senegalus TaxID=55291 RepID=UPI001963E8E2|nr:pro-neuregulin-2, membrane-bound isoform-like isoform X2 [Polypterus senegalus]
MRLDPVHFSMLVIGVSFACYSPSLNSLQDQAFRSAVVIEGKVQSVASNVTKEPHSVNVKVLDVWPLNSGGLQRNQLVTIGDFGSEAPCVKVKKNHKYIFFMAPTDEHLVFKASFAPVDTSGKNLKKDVGRILCEDCGAAPQLNRFENITVREGEKLTLKCEATGNPIPEFKWFRDGKKLKKSKEIRIRHGRRNSRLQIAKVKASDAGEYTCEAENAVGSNSLKSNVTVQSDTLYDSTTTILDDTSKQSVASLSSVTQNATQHTAQAEGSLKPLTENVSTPATTPSGSGHARKCNETEKAYCVNGGICYYIDGINQLSCKCPNEFTGHLGYEFKEAEELYQKRVLTITGICVALLVVGIVCVVAYCKTKKQRKKMHNHLRQNMCPDHQNRNLANGPNHPGPGPEELPMVDYISKNVPAAERIIRHEAETSFSGSHPSSTSHHSSTATHTSSHRHEDRTWSLDRTDSIISDSHSGIMSSSVGTSKCNSPACIEARTRRAAHCGIIEPRRAMMHYRDSIDSLRDSPHSDRYVSALTTPARLSPVDFHYSLPTQVPTFEITSPNSSHAVSLPPAAAMTYHMEEEQPLLRQYQVPLQDVQRHDPYYQRRSYLNDSTGSLPSSPFRMVEDDEYETTQEYLSALEQPKKTASSSKRWRKSKVNGHISQRRDIIRDFSSQSCMSISDSEEEQAGESTPFLSMQNMNMTANAEPSTVYRPGDNRTYYSFNRHTARGNLQTRITHTRSKQDSAPL